MKRRAATICAGFLLLASSGYVITRSLAQGPGNDATIFYFASRALFRGENPYDAKVMHAHWEESRRAGSVRPEPLPFANPPIVSLLVLPMVPFPIGIALRVFAFLNLACLYASIFVLNGFLPPETSPSTRFLLASWAVLMPPVMKVLSYGQSALLVCAPLAFALYCLRRSREAWAGIWLALSLAKFTITLPFLAVLALRGRWKATVTAVGVFLSANLALTLPLGLVKALSSYRAAIALIDGPNGVNDPFSPLSRETENIVSLKRFFILFLGPQRGAVGVAVLIASALLGLGFIYLIAGKRKTAPGPALEDPLEVALATMIGMALTYHRVYDLAALMFVFYPLVEYRLRVQRVPFPLWRASMGVVFFASFFVVGTGWSRPFDFVLRRLHGPSSPHFGSVAVLVLLVLIGLLMGRDSTHPDVDRPT